MAHNHVNIVTIKIKADEDCKVVEKKTNFFNLLDCNYEPGASVEVFYNQYRDLVKACLKKKGDTVMWQNSMVLTKDEQLSPTFEDLILVNVLRLIDTQLPGLIRDQYKHLIGGAKSLMDYKSDILCFAEKEGRVPTISDVRQLQRYYRRSQQAQLFVLPIKLSLFPYLKSNNLKC